MKKNLVILYAHLFCLSLFTTHRLRGLAFTPDMSSMMAEMSKNLFQNDAEASDFLNFIEEQGGIESITRTMLPQLEEQGMLSAELHSSFSDTDFALMDESEKKPKQKPAVDETEKLDKKTLFLTPPRTTDEGDTVVITPHIEAAFEHYSKSFVHYLRKMQLTIKAYKLGIDIKELTQLLLATATIEPDLITMLSFHKHDRSSDAQNPYLKEFFQKPYDATRKQILSTLQKLKKIAKEITALKHSSEEEFGEYDPATNTFKATPAAQERDALKAQLQELYRKNLKKIADNLQKIMKNPAVLKTIEALHKKQPKHSSGSSYDGGYASSSSDWGSGWSGGGGGHSAYRSSAGSYDDFGGYAGGSSYSPSSSSSHVGSRYGSSSDFSDTSPARYGSSSSSRHGGMSHEEGESIPETKKEAAPEEAATGVKKASTMLRSEQELKDEILLITNTLEKTFATGKTEAEQKGLMISLLEKNYLSTLEKTLRELARITTKRLSMPAQGLLTPFQRAIDRVIGHLFTLIAYDRTHREESDTTKPHYAVIQEELRAARSCIPLIVRGGYTHHASVTIKNALQEREQDELATLEALSKELAQHVTLDNLQRVVAVSTTLLQPPFSALYPELLDDKVEEPLSDFEKHVARSIKVLLQLHTTIYHQFVAKNSKKGLLENARDFVHTMESEVITAEQLTAMAVLFTSPAEKERFTTKVHELQKRDSLREYLNGSIAKLDEQTELCQNFMLMIKQSRIMETVQKVRQREQQRALPKA